MSAGDVLAFAKVLSAREGNYRDALDVMRDEVRESDDARAAAAARDLREAIELVGCLRRIVKGRSIAEIHAAFGAPGDFGYETSIGAALARVYGLANAEEAVRIVERADEEGAIR